MMNQQSLQDYLNLIQKLLDCPKGHEWELLQQHEKLITPELLQVMKQVARELVVEGNEKAAKFLSHWAAQLEMILNQTAHASANGDHAQSYLQLIQALIDCPKGAEAEILGAHPAFINPELVQTMKQVATQLALRGDRETASFLSHLAAELNHTWLQANALASEPLEKPTAQFSAKPELNPPETIQEPLTPPKIKEENQPKPSRQTNRDQHLSLSLALMAESLSQLNQTLTTRLPVADPLWYMDVLEKAYTAQWTLTTEELEKLIGVTPKCPTGKSSFARGGWIFLKVGKIGSQTAWRVMKPDNRDSDKVQPP